MRKGILTQTITTIRMIITTVIVSVKKRNEMGEKFDGKKIKAQEKQALRFHLRMEHILIQLFNGR